MKDYDEASVGTMMPVVAPYGATLNRNTSCLNLGHQDWGVNGDSGYTADWEKAAAFKDEDCTGDYFGIMR